MSKRVQGPGRFLFRSAFFGAAVVGCSVVLLVVMAQIQRVVEFPRLAALPPQLERLGTLPSPKIVLAGGSNLAYGVNSDMLSAAFDMPVLNLGIQAVLSIDFILASIRPHLREGDVVVVAMEAGEYVARSWSTTALVRVAAYDPSMLRYMSTRQIVGMPRHLFPSIFIQAKQFRNGLSRRLRGQPSFTDGLTPIGDYVGHRGKPSRFISDPFIPDLFNSTLIPPHRSRYLTEFSEYCRGRGIRLYFSHSVKAERLVDYEGLAAVTSYLRQNFEVIGDPESYHYPDSAFYDTEFHLIYEMRDDRTKKLIRDLEPYLSSPAG